MRDSDVKLALLGLNACLHNVARGAFGAHHAPEPQCSLHVPQSVPQEASRDMAPVPGAGAPLALAAAPAQACVLNGARAHGRQRRSFARALEHAHY